MLSAFKYRLYPRPEQEMRLDRSLLLLCNLYNDLKAEAMRKYREEEAEGLPAPSRIGRRLARLRLHIRDQREDFQNKVVHRVFTESDVLVLERLNVSGMLKNHSLAKSISDASWSSFARKAVFKADSLGRHTVLVDPWGTTQCCHRCLHLGPQGHRDARTCLPLLRRNHTERP